MMPELRAFVQTQIVTTRHIQIQTRSDGHFSELRDGRIAFEWSNSITCEEKYLASS
jgi:hypothetical protein